jgi:hypothetical protein
MAMKRYAMNLFLKVMAMMHLAVILFKKVTSMEP